MVLTKPKERRSDRDIQLNLNPIVNELDFFKQWSNNISEKEMHEIFQNFKYEYYKAGEEVF